MSLPIMLARMTTSNTPQSDQVNQTPSAMYAPMDHNRDKLNDEKADPQLKAVALRLYLQRSVDQNVQSGVTTGVSVMDLQSNKPLYEHDVDSEQFAASVNKLPIARLVLADLRSGKLTSDQQLTWTAADQRAGAGVYDQANAPMQATVKDLLFDMLNPSGNTAVRVFVNQAFGGADAVNQRFKTELGLQHTYLQPQGGNTFYVGNTTAREAMQNITGLLLGSDQYQMFVKNALATNIYTDYGVRTQLAGNDYITLANKVGILDDPDGNNRHDVGLIYNTRTKRTYGYAFINTAQGNAYNLATAQAGVSLADMGRGVLRYSGDKQNGTEKALRDQAPFVDKRVRY
jgi:beta-lactamase class A